MRLDDKDRGRLLLAAVLTLIALPAIWMFNRDNDDGSVRPNVAAVGLDPGQADDLPADTSMFARPQGDNPLGDSSAAYLEAPAFASELTVPEVAFGTAPGEFIGRGTATYRTSGLGSNQCLYNGARNGQRIVVINVANGRSAECTAGFLDSVSETLVVMEVGRFSSIADVTAVPIHVEIRTQ